MRQVKGQPFGIPSTPTIGLLTRESIPLLKRSRYVLVTDNQSAKDRGYAGIISTGGFTPRHGIALHEEEDLDFAPGDIVSLGQDGSIFFVWEPATQSNAVLVTEACNCRCIMCPQPPKNHDKALFNAAKRILSLVSADYIGSVAITGGEPTLLGNEFISLLKECRSKLPSAWISVLTNGKGFSNLELARKVALLGLRNFIFCVSMHADSDEIHDSIVGRVGSFRKTQQGIYNLAKFNLPIEIRVVVLKANHTRLPQIAEYIYRNYPFIDHITFMALEMTGLAKQNREQVWVDPWEYKDTLEIATHELHRRGMTVSVYNHQLCVLDPRTRFFARQSISHWKKSLLPVCAPCDVKDECCGVFTTSGDQLSKKISPLQGRLIA